MPAVQLTELQIEALIDFSQCSAASNRLSEADANARKALAVERGSIGVYVVDDMALEVTAAEIFATPVLAVIENGKQVK